MLSVSQCRRLLGSAGKALKDSEVRERRDLVRELSEILIDAYAESIEANGKRNPGRRTQRAQR